MKVVILAGGKGTRISEESQSRPKPMVEIGGRPILWHIMKIYSHYGYNEFIICCGYKGHKIKEYFVNYYKHQADNAFYLTDGTMEAYHDQTEPWKVTLVNTGLATLTAGRVLQIRDYVGEEPFFLTYGDGVADVNIPELLQFHRKYGRIATISTTQPAGRFGAIKIDRESGKVESFKEKARKDQAWVNMGFMVMNPEVFDYLGDGSEMLEQTPFEHLAIDEQMSAYQHPGFWSPMDTVHDRDYLGKLWSSEEAPWKVWE